MRLRQTAWCEVVKASYKDSGSVLDFDSFANTAGAAPKNTYSEKVVFKASLGG